ncbi:hypothetical protein [Corynebacterium bovis]|uniref:hypothetical protein n=1 Tax=Corynebacterium bovis TaxID=36808 RepID=UPI000F6405DD|nr:hypothetical protein [Corynebacterium bovis]
MRSATGGTGSVTAGRESATTQPDPGMRHAVDGYRPITDAVADSSCASKPVLTKPSMLFGGTSGVKLPWPWT